MSNFLDNGIIKKIEEVVNETLGNLGKLEPGVPFSIHIDPYTHTFPLVGTVSEEIVTDGVKFSVSIFTETLHVAPYTFKSKFGDVELELEPDSVQVTVSVDGTGSTDFPKGSVTAPAKADPELALAPVSVPA